MKIIALFFPAFISASIYCRRQHVEWKFSLFLIVRYIIYVMIVNWCDMALITYIIKPGVYVSNDMESFSFFYKIYFYCCVFCMDYSLFRGNYYKIYSH